MSQPTPGQTGTDTDWGQATLGTFRMAVHLVQDGLTQLENAWNALIDWVNGVLDKVRQALQDENVFQWAWQKLFGELDDLAKKIQSLVNEINPKIAQVFDALHRAVNGAAPVESLFEVGLDWATTVNPRLSDMGPDMTGEGTIDAWRGPAANTYGKRVADQVDALDSVVDKVKSTATWLAGVGQANLGYLAELADQGAELAKLIIALTADTAETAAGAATQAVVALDHTSELVGEVAAKVITYLTALADRLAEVLAQVTELAAEYGDHSGLPGGRWPQAVNG
jgi:ABC-type transporter Mla subunit MlaD